MIRLSVSKFVYDAVKRSGKALPKGIAEIAKNEKVELIASEHQADNIALMLSARGFPIAIIKLEAPKNEQT
jgi:hypothetical protein